MSVAFKASAISRRRVSRVSCAVRVESQGGRQGPRVQGRPAWREDCRYACAAPRERAFGVNDFVTYIYCRDKFGSEVL